LNCIFVSRIQKSSISALPGSFSKLVHPRPMGWEHGSQHLPVSGPFLGSLP
jgi:hypothetical protein